MARPTPPNQIPQPRLTPSSMGAQPDDAPPPGFAQRNARWVKLARDLAVTFLGVALALIANTWWQDRQDRSRERADLEQILVATRENEGRIVQAMYEDSVTSALASRTLLSLDAPAQLPALDSLAQWIPRSYWISEWHPVTGPYSALSLTGGLRLIRNARIRALIASHQGELEATMRAIGRVEPLTYHNVSETIRLLPTDRLSELRTHNATSSPDAQRLAENLRRNPDVRALLREDHFVATERVVLLKPLRTQTIALREALEHELGEAPLVSPHPHPIQYQ